MIVSVFLIKDEAGGGRRGSKVAVSLILCSLPEEPLIFVTEGFLFFLSRRKPNSVRLWREGAKENFFF